MARVASAPAVGGGRRRSDFPSDPYAQPAKTTAEQVADYIFDLILDRKLAPGERIDAQQIAQRFDVSRTPVREAILALAASGIVEIANRRFARVKGITTGRVEDVYAARLLVETFLVRVAVPRLSEADVAQLGELAERHFGAVDWVERVRLNEQLHWTIYRASNLAETQAIAHNLWTQAQHFQALLARDVPMEEARDHRPLVTACLARDPAKAVSELSKHLMCSVKALLGNVAEGSVLLQALALVNSEG